MNEHSRVESTGFDRMILGGIDNRSGMARLDGKLNLIDWEYACDNDPLFDLASAIGFHNLDERRQQVFLDAYAGGADSELRERLARQLRIYDAIQWLWLANRQLASPRSEQARRLEELQQRIR